MCVACHTSGLNTGQCLCQNLETGCRELAIVKFLGVLFLKVDHSTQITTIQIIEIRHDILIQCDGNYIEVETHQLYA